MSPVLKRKPEKKKLPSKYVLIIFTCIAILLMIISLSGTLPDRIINNVFGNMIVPFQKGLSSITISLIENANNKQRIEDLQAENLELRQQIDDLTNENTLLLQDKYELTDLRELYKLDEKYSEYPKTGATIVSWDNTNWFSSFIIDKGTNDGIQVDMNVIAGSGLVGRVSEVGSNWARVTSIIDDNSNVSAYILHSGDNLVVSGDLTLIEQGFISYSGLVDSSNNVEKGDKVVTSYISDKYLPGILIGYISTIGIDSNNLTKSGYIVPVVDFSKITRVLVITQLKEDYTE